MVFKLERGAMEMAEELPEACEICLKLSVKKGDIYPRLRDGEFYLCNALYGEGGNTCLPKDRAMIVLLDKLLKKLDSID